MVQNIARGAMYNAAGEFNDRWPLLAKRIKEIKPDLLLLTELSNWKGYGHKQYVRAANDLDLDVAPIPPSQTGNATGLMYRRNVLGRWQSHKDGLVNATTHGFGVTGFEVGLPKLLNIAPVHLCYYSALIAAEEAKLITNTAHRNTSFAIIGGDCNYTAAEDEAPDFAQFKPFNLTSRTVIDSAEESPGKLKPDRGVAWTFMRAGYVDAARHLYKQTKDEGLLQRTAADSGRIDQFWVSKAIAPALEHYSAIPHDPKVTDHAGIVIKIDTDKVDTEHMWEPDKL